MNREFTGRHMALVLIIGFGIVAAVNFYMASLATGGFHGVVVENTYVASQKFNGWIEEAKKNQALGWEVELSRDVDGHITAHTSGVPSGARMTAELRRPLGAKEFASLTFERGADETYRSMESLTDGRWTARLSVVHGEDSWQGESEIR